MAIRKYIGTVSTNKVGSGCEFEFEIDDEDLPEDPEEARSVINNIALEALWDSGKINWAYGEVAESEE